MEAQNEFWDNRARHYGHTGWSSNLIYYYDQPLRIKALEHFVGQAGPYHHILDFGCGVGDISRMLAMHAARVTAYDISTVSLELAQKNNYRKNITYSCAYEHLFQTDQPYDFVLAITVMQHILDDARLAEVLRALAQTMAPGAPLIILDTFSEIVACNHYQILRRYSAFLEMAIGCGFKHQATINYFHQDSAPTIRYSQYSSSLIPSLLHRLSKYNVPFTDCLLKKIAKHFYSKDAEYFSTADSPSKFIILHT